MNKGLRNEIMLLGMLGSLGALLLGKRKLEAGLAASSAALLLTVKIDSSSGKIGIGPGQLPGLDLALAKQDEKDLNQIEKMDARYNAGLLH